MVIPVQPSNKRKVHSLTGRITPELMRKAFKAVKRNRGAAGVDKVSINMFEKNLDENLDALMRQLKSGAYQPYPLRRAYIEKDGKNELRPLGIPAVRCRIAQEVVRQLIDPIFELTFHEHSFSFRKFRNCHQAIEQVIDCARQGYKIAVDVDVKGFFDNIPHYLIIKLVEQRIADGNILSLIEKFLRSGVMEDGVVKPTRKGTPQGGVISPLLANIVLNQLDWKLQAKGYKFARYADDFVVMCESIAQAEEAFQFVRNVVEGELELKIHPLKSRIVRFSEGFDFLGFRISARSIRMRDKAVEKFKMKIRKLTIRHHNLDANVIIKVNRAIRGTMNYFATEFAHGAMLFRQLDKWIRKRIRCMKYKRIWRTDNCRLRNKHIRRLGLLSCRELYDRVKERCASSPA